MNEQTLTSPVNQQDHVQGQAGAPVTPVEYGHYECPYRGLAESMVKDTAVRSRIRG